MIRIKVFISSVQSEFAQERKLLFDYLTTDALLGRFFVHLFSKIFQQSAILHRTFTLAKWNIAIFISDFLGKAMVMKTLKEFHLLNGNLTMQVFII